MIIDFISASELLKVLKNTQTVGCYSALFIYGILWAQSFFKKKTTPSPYLRYHSFGLGPEFGLSKCHIQIDIFLFICILDDTTLFLQVIFLVTIYLIIIGLIKIYLDLTNTLKCTCLMSFKNCINII